MTLLFSGGKAPSAEIISQGSARQATFGFEKQMTALLRVKF